MDQAIPAQASCEAGLTGIPYRQSQNPRLNIPCFRLAAGSSDHVLQRGRWASAWRNASLLDKQLSHLQIGRLKRLGSGGEGSQCCPQIDERLHWLEVSLLEKVERGGCQNKMAEAAVHRLLQVEAEHVLKMGPVEVGVDSEHLAEDGLAELHKVLGEPAPLSHPVLTGLGHGSAKGRVVGVAHASCLGGKDGRVVDLARDVALN